MNPISLQISQWILQQATGADDPATLLDGFCQALTKAGLPLWRVNVSTPAIDPTARSFGITWMPDKGPTAFRTAHGPDYESDFRRSPLYPLIEGGLTFGRWDLRALPPDEDLPVLQSLRSKGGTDYVLHMVVFAPGTALRGMGLSVCTTKPSGFSDQDLATLAEVLPAFGLAISKLGLSQTLRETLATYLGPATGARVLDGEIIRGQGQRMAAAILLVDLRGFTALADRMNPVDVVGWLDEHFEALGDPVARHGGEILKFLGDGFLAVFPVLELNARPCAVCGSALDAAEEALAANRALNVGRRAAGLPALDADLVLHFGEVVYGNVGTSRRLDFTVIGRAVNEASRIEKLCGDLGRSLLMSESFAARCDRVLAQVGTVSLRGLEQPHRIWTVPD